MLIEIANCSAWLSSAEAKTVCRPFMGPKNTRSSSSLFIINVFYVRTVSHLKYCPLLLKNCSVFPLGIVFLNGAVLCLFIFVGKFIYLGNHSKTTRVSALDFLISRNLQQGMNENRNSVNSVILFTREKIPSC